MKDEDLQLNKGVELMLRRRTKDNPDSKGLKVHKTFSLGSKLIRFKFEFTWESIT